MMAIDSTFQEVEEITADNDRHAGRPPVFKNPGSGKNGNGNGHNGHPIHNRILAMALFIGADIMFFAGLIGSFMVFRFGADDWPPPGQPLLPLGVTGLNTAVLLFSGFTMVKTWRLLGGDWKRNKIRKWLDVTTLFGIIFLIVQGFEWFRLLGYGLKLSSGVYGATFYTIIGCHAVHVLGAVIWLSIVTVRWRINPNLYSQGNHSGIKIAGMYWVLVVALWPVLYGLVYFS